MEFFIMGFIGGMVAGIAIVIVAAFVLMGADDELCMACGEPQHDYPC